MREIFNDVIGLIGIALLIFGTTLISIPAGIIVTGICLIVIAMILSMNPRRSDKEGMR